MAARKSRPNRWPKLVVGTAASIAAGALLAWALLGVMQPVTDPLESSRNTIVTVLPGSVESSLELNAIAAWAPVPAGTNRASGVVTTVAAGPGRAVSPGDVLYSVDTRPVVIARGEVPAFRSITAGVEGPDVTQLQNMLAELGHYHFQSDGKAEQATVAAIREWQGSLGLRKTGVVEIGDVIFVTKLPARVVLDDKVVRRGATLTGGEDVLRALPASPTFVIPVTGAQANRIPLKTEVDVTSPRGDTWAASVTGITRREDGSAVLRVARDDGTPLCGRQCEQIPVTGGASLSSRTLILKTVKGLVVPSAALDSMANGKTTVVTRSGKRIPVTVRASANGMSVVEGVRKGLKIQVHSDDSEEQ